MEIRLPLSFAFQLGGAEPPQRAEDPVPDQRQQLEGDEVVARLLGIAQQPAHQRKHHHRRPKQKAAGVNGRGKAPTDPATA